MEVVNSYWWNNNVLSPEECEEIIRIGTLQMQQEEKDGKSTAATTLGNNHKEAMPNAAPRADITLDELTTKENLDREEAEKSFYIRDTKVTFLSDQWIYDKIIPKLDEINHKAGWKYDIDYYEHFQFAEYGVGAFYGWHCDGLGDHNSVYKRVIAGLTDESPVSTKDPNKVGKVRKLSLTINLNRPGEYEGGNLKFDFGPHARSKRYHECIEIRPQGSMVVFPSYVYHEVTPVTFGTRYSLVLWALGKPFK